MKNIAKGFGLLVLAIATVAQAADGRSAVSGGIEAEMQFDNGKATVKQVVAGGPAEAAGVRDQDRIVNVNGWPVSGMTLQQFSAQLRGEPGTDVVLDVVHSDGTDDSLHVTRIYMKSLDGPGQAVEKSQALRDYEKAIFPLARSVTVANTVYACQLRSGYWYQSLSEGYQLTKIKLSQRLHLSPMDQSAADGDERAANAEVAKQYRLSVETCGKLTNSPEVAALDSLQRQVTGNYH